LTEVTENGAIPASRHAAWLRLLAEQRRLQRRVDWRSSTGHELRGPL